MEKMRYLRVYCTLTAFLLALVWSVACAAQPEMPTKQGHPPDSTSASENTGSASGFAASEAQLRRDLEAHPDSATTLYKLGQILRFENKPKESLEIYTQAARLQRPDAEELRSVALDYVLLNDYADAIHWLEVAVSLYPRSPELYYSLGRCYYSENRFHDAETMFLKTLEIKPDHLKAEENLGLVYDFDNQPDKAEAALRAVVQWAGHESKDEWPFLDLGSFLLDHDRFAEAVPFLRRATDIASSSAVCHEKLGRALVATKDAAAGVKELEIAAKIDPENPKVHFELGRAYRDAGNPEKSKTEFALSQTLYGQHSRN